MSKSVFYLIEIENILNNLFAFNTLILNTIYHIEKLFKNEKY